jgi:hypothetical protein
MLKLHKPQLYGRNDHRRVATRIQSNYAWQVCVEQRRAA